MSTPGGPGGESPKKRKPKMTEEKRHRQFIKEISQQNALKYQHKDSLHKRIVKGRTVYVQTDRPFWNSVKAIARTADSYYLKVKKYCCPQDISLMDEEYGEIDHHAQLHRQANMVNMNGNLKKNILQTIKNRKAQYCYCGCERFRGEKYSLGCDIFELFYLGSGILQLFLFLRGLFIMMLLMVLIYGIFCLVIYASGSRYLSYPPDECTSSFCQLMNVCSSYNLPNFNQTLNILQWLGLCAMLLWMVVARFIKYLGTYMNGLIDKHLSSSADRSLKIDDLPEGEFNEQSLMQYMDILKSKSRPLQLEDNNEPKSQQQLEDKYTKDDKDKTFNIVGIQIIYKMEFSRQLIEKIIEDCTSVLKLIQEQQNLLVVEDDILYMQLKGSIIERYQAMEDFRKKFLNDVEFRSKISTRSALIHFEKPKMQTEIIRQFGKQNRSAWKQLVKKLTFWRKDSNVQNMFGGQYPSITRAPEPSDIIWQNCEHQPSFKRYFLISLFAILVIAAGFGVITGLEIWKATLQNVSNEPSMLISFLNNVTVFVLLIVNGFLSWSLKKLLGLQYNHTHTDRIVAELLLVSIAKISNIILVPIIVNYLIFDKYYGQTGVSGIVFDYQLKALIVTMPIFAFFPLEWLNYVTHCWVCVRNWRIRRNYHKDEKSSFQVKQDLMKDVYKFYEAPQFLIEDAYLTILPNVMHALFFCQLQPIILFFVCLQVFVFYWACKWRVLKWCKVPNLSENTIFEKVIYYAMMGPIFYGTGCIYNAFVSMQLDPQVKFYWIGSAIVLIVAALNYFNINNIFQIAVDNLAECLPYFNKQAYFKDLGKKTQDIQNKRSDSYYKDCNSLTLLGFESKLLNRANLERYEVELERFCKNYGSYARVKAQDEEKILDIKDHDRKENFQILVKKKLGEEDLMQDGEEEK